MSDKADQIKMAAQIQHGLFGVAGLSVACAILHGIFPDRFDEKTAMFLVVSVVALVIHQVTKFKGFGIEVEKQVEQLKKDMKSVEVAFGGLEKVVGPGSKTAVPPPGVLVESVAGAPSIDPSDPNKGQFGGASEANGRKLTASIEPLAGPKSARCRVTIRVESTVPANPLTGKVRLHLHPTFGQWSFYDVEVKGGVAEDEIVSYGAFTIGAEADGGATRLELDLVDVPGGTRRFYEQ